ncbi:MAG: argininosuccinate lyase, partial [Chloroflexi bacterium]|nr:argininosuccinate lyase [Chloroflexota bacterium]
MMSKLWGGRFRDNADPLMAQFNASIGFDARLWEADIRGSQAWAQALAEAGILSENERDMIMAGLDHIHEEWMRGEFQIKEDDEDIHTAVERRLTELIGPVGGKLHTGRSRNDQVATDLRLYLLDASDSLEEGLGHLQQALIEQAERYLDLIMPGY